MAATLYLNPDGLLRRQRNHRSARGSESAPDSSLVDATRLLEQLLVVFPRTEVVLHSYSVKLLGYRHVVLHLSPLIRSHVIGATYAGNRLVQFHFKRRWRRRDWLRDDLRRRAPAHPIVVDSDWMQMLPELAHVTLIVTGSQGLGASGMGKALFDLLRNAESGCELPLYVGCSIASVHAADVQHGSAPVF